MSTIIVNPYRYAGGFVSDIYQPASTTALLRASFSSNATAAGFETNSISATVSGTLTPNSTGGLGDGGFASGWVLGTNYIDLGSQGTGTPYLTLIAAIKTTEGAAAIGINAPKVVVFGDHSGTVRVQWGISNGRMHMACDTATEQGTIDVDDGNWHLIAWQQVDDDDWNMWVDGVKDSATVTTPNHVNELLTRVGSGYPYSGSIACPNIDAVQIYSPTLSDSDLGEIFTAAGY